MAGGATVHADLAGNSHPHLRAEAWGRPLCPPALLSLSQEEAGTGRPRRETGHSDAAPHREGPRARLPQKA